MHRTGHIIEEIVEFSNLSEAFDRVLAGSKRKRSRQGRRLLADRDNVLRAVRDEILNDKFTIRMSDLKEDDIIEGGKQRHIQFLRSYEKRILLNAVMNVVDKHLKRRFIRTTSASIEGRGLHDLMKYIRDDIRKDPDGTTYAYVFDIVKCYESTDQSVAVDAVRRVFKDRRLLNILERCISVLDRGVSIGLRTSQGIVNLILSVHLDHVLKSECGYRHYYRYCDNGLVLCETKEECLEVQGLVRRQMDSIGYRIHKERIFPITEGIDALGFVIFPDHVRLRKRIKKNFARKMLKVKSRRRRRELIASFYGMAKHADCHNLFFKLTGKKMKSFKDLNVSYKPEDGKKRFPGAVTSIRDLTNLSIVVKDFEVGIKTDQGDDRYIVAVEDDGVPKKFFTNSEEMKNILNQVKDMGELPFETVIKAEKFAKNKTKYIFT